MAIGIGHTFFSEELEIAFYSRPSGIARRHGRIRQYLLKPVAHQTACCGAVPLDSKVRMLIEELVRCKRRIALAVCEARPVPAEPEIFYTASCADPERTRERCRAGKKFAK